MTMPNDRTCAVCGDKHFGLGFCRKHYNADVYARNTEAVKARTSAWAKAHPEQVLAAQRAWRAKNPDKAKALNDIWRKKNAAKIAKKREANRDKQRIYNMQWYARHADIAKLYSSNRKARVRGASGKHTIAEIRQLFERQRGCCSACRNALNKYHKDHIIALINGGTNDIGNIQLLCPSCNLSKKAKHPIEFMQSKGFLL